LRKDLGLTQEQVLLKNVVECFNHLQFMKDVAMVAKEEAKLRNKQ